MLAVDVDNGTTLPCAVELPLVVLGFRHGEDAAEPLGPSEPPTGLSIPSKQPHMLPEPSLRRRI